MPCVILEALCCGLPVISSNVGGIAEVIDETNGILVENENTEELAKAMQNLLDNYMVYDRSAIAARATAKFNYDTVSKLYLNVYNNTPQPS